MNFDKEKIRTALNAVHNACLHCGTKHRNDCPISLAGTALKTLE